MGVVNLDVCVNVIRGSLPKSSLMPLYRCAGVKTTHTCGYAHHVHVHVYIES